MYGSRHQDVIAKTPSGMLTVFPLLDLSVTCPSGNIFLTNANYALCGTAGQSQVPTACRSSSVLVYSATARTWQVILNTRQLLLILTDVMEI